MLSKSLHIYFRPTVAGTPLTSLPEPSMYEVTVYVPVKEFIMIKLNLLIRIFTPPSSLKRIQNSLS